jgi:hypothetical protein
MLVVPPAEFDEPPKPPDSLCVVSPPPQPPYVAAARAIEDTAKAKSLRMAAILVGGVPARQGRASAMRATTNASRALGVGPGGRRPPLC